MSSSPWWKDGVVYQIYPRSFADSNGDGIGDLPGIRARLGYLADLGVDAIWLSPIYPSPMKDFGYDVSDYCAIHPLFGTLADFDALVKDAHARGIRIILDMVMNHTSTEHRWFVESRQSRDNPMRDFYLWRDGRGGGPPNNWCSVFGGPAWELDPLTGQYYLHLFDPSQPDLNWRNPEVKREMMAIWRFWLDRGADGFRLDVAHLLVKHSELPDHPAKLGVRDYDRQHHFHHENLEETHALWKELRTLLDGYEDRMAVGEVDLKGAGAEGYYGTGSDELHLAFNFNLMWIPFKPAAFQRVVLDWERRLPEEAWPCWVLSNHDQRRHASRWGGLLVDGDARARVAAVALLTLRGTPFLYYGEELGMREVFIPRVEIRDPPGRRYWPVYRGRDGWRTPMQWSAAPGAGFTTGTPWMRIAKDYEVRNVSRQHEDPGSLLNLYREVIRLRREMRVLRQGSFRALDERPRTIWRYVRELDGAAALVCLNFGAFAGTTDVSAAGRGPWVVRLSSANPARKGARVEGTLRLGRYEAVVLERQG